MCSDGNCLKEIKTIKELLSASYEREMFYKDERDRLFEVAENWKAECRRVAVACGWSRSEYDEYIKERAAHNG